MKDNETWLRIKSSYGFWVFKIITTTMILGWLGNLLMEWEYMAMVFVNDALIGSFITLVILHMFRMLDTGEQTPDIVLVLYLGLVANAVLHG